MDNRKLFSTALLLVLCTSALAAFSQPVYAEQNTAPTSYQTIAIGSTIQGQISGTNKEDYYLVSFNPGYYNMTLTSKMGGLRLELDRIARGYLQPLYSDFSMIPDGFYYDIIMQGFLPSLNFPVDMSINAHADYSFSLFQEGTTPQAPLEYLEMMYLSGLSIVYPPAGNYVIKVYYESGALPANYNLTVRQKFGVTTVTEGVEAKVNNLGANYYVARFDGDAIFKFTPPETDLYMVNASWNHSNDNVTILVSDSRGIVRVMLEKTWAPGGQEHVYTVMRQNMDYYVTLIISKDSAPTGPMNVSLKIEGMNAQVLTPGTTINGTFTNPYERTRELYILDYQIGNLYNITLGVPDTADYNLYLDSPFYGTAPWNEIWSSSGGVGEDENFTMFAAAVGFYAAIPANSLTVASSYIAPFPVPDSIIVGVGNSSGYGNYNLTATSYPMPTYDIAQHQRFSFTASNRPWLKYFKIAEKAGYEYEITWSYNATAGAGMAPVLGLAQPMSSRIELGLYLGNLIPEYYALPHTIPPGGSNPFAFDFLMPYSQNGTQRLDFYSNAGGTSIVFAAGIDLQANMSLTITEKPADGLSLGAKSSGHVNLGEGALYKIHLGVGTYKFIVNRTTAHTGGSLYQSHELPMVIFDGAGNYVPIGSFYPFSSDYQMNYAYTYVNVPSEGDYYIWIEEWTALPFSETDYIVWVEPLTVAPTLVQSIVPIAAGLGVGLALGIGLMYFLKKKK